MLDSLPFYVQPVSTNRKYNSFPPLFEIVISNIRAHSYTKRGERGASVLAVIHWGNFNFEGASVCVPKDDFDFKHGAKLALARALNNAGSFIAIEDHINIWNAFFDVMNQVGVNPESVELVDQWRRAPMLKRK